MFRAASAGPKKVMTANRLDDGRVVFLDDGNNWVLAIDSARLLEGGPDADAANAFAMEQQKARIVVEPYLVDVDNEDDGIVPIRLRERIRALGPSVDYGYDERARLGQDKPVDAAAE